MNAGERYEAADESSTEPGRLLIASQCVLTRFLIDSEKKKEVKQFKLGENPLSYESDLKGEAKLIFSIKKVGKTTQN